MEKVTLIESKKCKVIVNEGGSVVIDCGKGHKIELAPIEVRMMGGVSEIAEEAIKEKKKVKR